MLKGKITPALCINLEDYEVKLERLNGLVQNMSSIDWTVENAIQFCKDHGLQIEDSTMHQLVSFQTLLNDLNTIDYNSLKNVILVCKQQITGLKCEKFDEYNLAYQNYINNILSDKNKNLDAFFSVPLNVQSVGTYLKNVVTQLTQLVKSLDSATNDLFEHFKYGNKNYVIFGKNGAGKTTLLRQISGSIFKNAIVVPADRTVMQASGSFISVNSNYTLNKMLKIKLL